MVVESQGAAGDEGESGEAGGAHGENQLVVQVVKRNWLKDEIYVGGSYLVTLTMMNNLVRLIATRRPQVMVNPQEERQKQRRTADICHRHHILVEKSSTLLYL